MMSVGRTGLVLLFLFALGGCRADQRPQDAQEIMVVVRASPDGDAITLSRKQAAWFAKDLTGQKYRSRISEFKAAPIAWFERDGKQYLMHGNAVIHLSDD